MHCQKLVLKPNAGGFITHWLICGAKEKPYSTDYFNPNQLEFEKKLREVIADDSLAGVPEDIRLGGDGLDGYQWRYYQAGDNWFVDTTRFYFLLSGIELYGSTVISVPDSCVIPAVLWTYAAADVWVNGKKAVSSPTPVYKPIKRVEFDLELLPGDNHIFVRMQNLGVRDTRNIFGIQLVGDCSRVTVKTKDWETLQPVIYAEQCMRKVVIRNSTLVSPEPPPFELEIENIGIWKSGCEYPLPEDEANITLVTVVNGIRLVRKLENAAACKPVYSNTPDLEQHRRFLLETTYSEFENHQNAEHRLDAVLYNLYKGDFAPGDFDRIRYALPSIDNREDCADFKLSSLLRIMLTAGNRMPEELQQQIKEVVLRFRYWMDENGSDGMCFWSENHALCFYGCQLMAGKLYPDGMFTRSGRSGTQQWELGNKRCREWLDSIEQTGFEEFLSPGYMCVTAEALLVLIDYAKDDVAQRAWKVMDKLMEMMFTHCFDGCLVSPNGRIYHNVITPAEQGFQKIFTFYNPKAPVATGTTPIMLLHTRYRAPEHLTDMMEAPVNKVYQTGNAEVSICKTKDYILTGVASERSDNFEGGWCAKDYLDDNPYETGNFSYMYVKALNEKYHGTTLFQPGVYGYQQHMWCAALSNRCLVMVNHPGATAKLAVMRPGYWFGNGIMPAIRQWGNTLLAIYSTDSRHPINFTHTYFPIHTFEQVQSYDNRLFGKCGNGLIALWCSEKLVPHNDTATDCEYRAYGISQAYVCICSDISTEGSFENFVSRCMQMNICYDPQNMTLDDGNGHSIQYIARYNDTQVI